MKLWRKHNSTDFVRKNPKHKITRKERRTFFVSEHKTHSKLLTALLARVGVEVASI